MSYTVNYCCNAAGQYLPPYIIYKNKTIYPCWTEGGPPGTKFTVSPSGWMESDQFIEWFRGIFLEGTAKLVGPKVLFVDGHNSHVSLELIDLAIENKVTILYLPPHSSAHFQPLDVTVYSEVKRNWRVILNNFYRTTKSESITKQSFPRLINELHKVAFKPHHATAGFFKTGLYPLDPNQVSLNSELVDLHMPHAVEPEGTALVVESEDTPGTDQTPEPSFISPEPPAKPQVTSNIQITKLPNKDPVQADNPLSPLKVVSQNLTSSILKHLSFQKDEKSLSRKKGIDVGGKSMTGNLKNKLECLKFFNKYFLFLILKHPQ